MHQINTFAVILLEDVFKKIKFRLLARTKA